MKAIVRINLSYDLQVIGTISKEFVDLPNVFCSNSVNADIKLTNNLAISEQMKVTKVNLDSQLVTLEPCFNINITEYLEIESASQFFKEVEMESWEVTINEQAIAKLTEPARDDSVVDYEEKPKRLFSSKIFLKIFFIPAGLYILLMYFFAYENFNFEYIIVRIPIFLIIAFLSAISLNKAKRDKEVLNSNDE